MPALSLKSYGTIRDIDKWKSRDKRNLKRDKICFEEFNPYITGKMMRGVDALTRLIERDPEAKTHNYNRTTIRASMIPRSIKLYNSAIAASLGMMLRMGDYNAAEYDHTEWIDIAGQYLPLGLTETLLKRIAAKELTIDAINEQLATWYANYNDMAAAYAYDVLTSLMGHTPTNEDVADTITASENILQRMRATTEADRERDGGLDMMVGYGYDFRDYGEQVADFLNTR